jgi:phage shock protein C
MSSHRSPGVPFTPMPRARLAARPHTPRVPVTEPGRPTPRLWRSRSERVVAGVLGGLAEKFGWEPRPVRLLAGLLGVLTLPLASMPLIVPYVSLWLVTRAYGPTTPVKPFRRSRTNYRVAGVLGGLAARFGMSPVAVRAIYSALTVATFVLPGVVTYLVLWAATPTEESSADTWPSQEWNG